MLRVWRMKSSSALQTWRTNRGKSASFWILLFWMHICARTESGAKAKPTEYILDTAASLLPSCPIPCAERSQWKLEKKKKHHNTNTLSLNNSSGTPGNPQCWALIKHCSLISYKKQPFCNTDIEMLETFKGPFPATSYSKWYQGQY